MGCSVKLGLVYAANPRLSRYSTGMSEPKDMLVVFSEFDSSCWVVKNVSNWFDARTEDAEPTSAFCQKRATLASCAFGV